MRKRCTTCTAAPSPALSIEKRSTSASSHGLPSAPGGCRYGGAHAAAPSGGGMRGSRTDRRSGRATGSAEAEVGRFEPVIAFAMKNNKAGENPTPPRPRPRVLAARPLGAPRAHPPKRQGKCGRGGRRGLGRNAAPPSISGLRRCDFAHGTRFHFFAETVG